MLDGAPSEPQRTTTNFWGPLGGGEIKSNSTGVHHPRFLDIYIDLRTVQHMQQALSYSRLPFNLDHLMSSELCRFELPR